MHTVGNDIVPLPAAIPCQCQVVRSTKFTGQIRASSDRTEPLLPAEHGRH